MKTWRNNLDEMQEQKLLRIEHNGCWLAFWGMLAALMIQSALFAGDFRIIAGEWIVFMVLAVYLCGACMRSGIWSRSLGMDMKTNALASLAAGCVVFLFILVTTGIRYGSWAGALAGGLIGGGTVFVLCLAALALAARSTRKKLQQLEAEPVEEG